MKLSHRSILSRLDDAVRWTGIPARVASEMSGAPSVDRKHRLLRWIPIWLLAFSCALFILSFTLPPALVSLALSLGVVVAVMAPAIHRNGPLGKPWLEDDEREAALRRDSFLFCFGLLACLNCLGQPALMILSHFRGSLQYLLPYGYDAALVQLRPHWIEERQRARHSGAPFISKIVQTTSL